MTLSEQYIHEAKKWNTISADEENKNMLLSLMQMNYAILCARVADDLGVESDSHLHQDVRQFVILLEKRQQILLNKIGKLHPLLKLHNGNIRS